MVRAPPWWTSPRLTKTVLIGLVGALVLAGPDDTGAAVLARKNTALREAREQLRGARDELAKRYRCAQASGRRNGGAARGRGEQEWFSVNTT